jgi:hypothetical protein
MKTKPNRSNPAPKLEQALWWALALGCMAVLLVAAMLEPDARGYGTHAQLGLPPCGFLLFTGAPCPGCGLTTAFAHAIRGNFALALDANPFGLLLFAAVSACVPLGVLAAWRRWSVDSVLQRFAIGRLALGVAGCGVAVWVVRLASAL